MLDYEVLVKVSPVVGQTYGLLYDGIPEKTLEVILFDIIYVILIPILSVLDVTHPALHVTHPVFALQMSHPALHVTHPAFALQMSHPALHVSHPALYVTHPALHMSLSALHVSYHALTNSC